MESNVVGPTAADVSKICQDMNDLQVRFNKITSADFRSKSSKPWKPEVTPPRRRGVFNRGRGGRQFDNVQRNDRFKNSESNGNQDRDNSQRNNTGNFRDRGQGRDMILSDYLSRHRQKNLDPSELMPISFCCLKAYRSIIDDRIGEEIFCIKTRASAKASGENVGEVHGADKPLDPNYKPEHQSKSKFPSVIGKLSPEKVVENPYHKPHLGTHLED